MLPSDLKEEWTVPLLGITPICTCDSSGIDGLLINEQQPGYIPLRTGTCRIYI